MSNLLKKDKGFTLIEIVLVLAIAGLIMVIVFLAVSGAQKSRRDTQRKNDIGRIAAGLENYASNNNGSYPTVAQATTGGVMASYLPGANYLDPATGTVYGTSSATAAAVIISTAATAPAAPAAATVSYALPSARVYTVCIGLEQGASSCRTNN